MRTPCFPSTEYYGLSSPALFEVLAGFTIHTTATMLAGIQLRHSHSLPGFKVWKAIHKYEALHVLPIKKLNEAFHLYFIKPEEQITMYKGNIFLSNMKGLDLAVLRSKSLW